MLNKINIYKSDLTLSFLFYLDWFNYQINGVLGQSARSEFNNYNIRFADYLSRTCLNLLYIYIYILLKAQGTYVLRFATNCVIANFCVFADVRK